MTEDDKAIVRKLRLLEKHAKELSHMIPSDDGIADAVGVTREVEVLLSETRRKWESAARAEMEPIRSHDTSKRKNPRDVGAPVAVGKRYELVPQYKVERSYNSPAILSAIADQGNGEIIDALMLARRYDAVRLTWRWTELQSMLSTEQIALRLAYEETSDDAGTDGPFVGQRKVDAGMKRVLIEEAS